MRIKIHSAFLFIEVTRVDYSFDIIPGSGTIMRIFLAVNLHKRELTPTTYSSLSISKKSSDSQANQRTAPS